MTTEQSLASSWDLCPAQAAEFPSPLWDPDKNKFQHVSQDTISFYCQTPTPTSSSTTLLSLYRCLDLRTGAIQLKKNKKGKTQRQSGGNKGQTCDTAGVKHCLTCRPMTHCPAFIFSSSNDLCCLSAYFTPMLTRVWQPLVLAWQKRRSIFYRWMQGIYLELLILRSFGTKTHHASERKECRLDLSHVAALKQVVGLKDVMRFETVGCEGFDKVRQVLQLQNTIMAAKLILLQDWRNSSATS